MKSRDTISASTHAELLNKLLHTHLKAYMRCKKDLHNGYAIWMIKLDGRQSPLGWTNSKTDDGSVVVEEYTGNPATELVTHKALPNEKRLIFEIIDDTCAERYYIFLGAFEMDKSSTCERRQWNRIADEYRF